LFALTLQIRVHGTVLRYQSRYVAPIDRGVRVPLTGVPVSVSDRGAGVQRRGCRCQALLRRLYKQPGRSQRSAATSAPNEPNSVRAYGANTGSWDGPSVSESVCRAD